MTPIRLAGLTALAMLAFAGNSLLCRLALERTAIDPASFMTLRLGSAALLLWLMARARRSASRGGDWRAALVLIGYAVTFTYAYVSLPAGAGALLLFGASQVTMIGWGLARGERLRGAQIVGTVLAFAGLAGLLSPGMTAPPLVGGALMLAAGVAWGAYSLLGRAALDPIAANAGGFVRAVPLAALVSLVTAAHASFDPAGVLYALLSGAVTTGLGYVVWYTVLPSLRATQAATVQLSVPVLTALLGIAALGEPLTLRLVLAAAAILGGIALVMRAAPRRIAGGTSA